MAKALPQGMAVVPSSADPRRCDVPCVLGAVAVERSSSHAHSKSMILNAFHSGLSCRRLLVRWPGARYGVAFGDGVPLNRHKADDSYRAENRGGSVAAAFSSVNSNESQVGGAIGCRLWSSKRRVGVPERGWIRRFHVQGALRGGGRVEKSTALTAPIGWILLRQRAETFANPGLQWP